MTEKTIHSVNEVYDACITTSYKWHSVKFPELRNYSHCLYSLADYLGEDTEDDFWRPIVRSLKRFQFNICAAPFTDEVLSQQLHDIYLMLKENERSCKWLYPEVERYYYLLLHSIENLSETNLSMILKTLPSVLNKNSKQIALLVKEPRHVSPSEEAVSQLQCKHRISVINPNMLREDACYDQLIVVGPTRWFPKYVFSAPRSQDITVVKFSWIKDSWKLENVFIKPIKQRQKKKPVTLAPDNDKEALEPIDLLPVSLDFDRIAKSISQEISGTDEDSVDSKLFLLEEGWAVFLESDDNSSVLVIDLDSDTSNILKRMKVGQLLSGMFVLLRTGGGGDFVVPVANALLGENAEIAREFQKEWKRHLRTQVRKRGYERVIEELSKRGSKRASRDNIRNWMSERNIKTEDPADFFAIMDLVGLNEDREYYWEMMRSIKRAHLKAGVVIRKMLLKQVESSDLSKLKRTGKMEFSIPSEENVSITAFQIKDISTRNFQVAPWRIGDPFEPED